MNVKKARSDVRLAVEEYCSLIDAYAHIATLPYYPTQAHDARPRRHSRAE